MDDVSKDSAVSTNQQTDKRVLLTDALPEFATELRQLLIEQSETAGYTGTQFGDFRTLPLRRRLLRHVLHATEA
jgi:hypothetical protein